MGKHSEKSVWRWAIPKAGIGDTYGEKLKSIYKKGKMKKYYVYNDKKLVFTGDHTAICNEFGLSRKSLYEYAKGNRKIHGLYRVLKDKLPEKPLDVVDIENDPFEYLKYHLNKYGNTVCMFDPVPYLPDLFDIGLDCRVKEVSEAKRRDGLRTPKARRKKEKVHYIVEVAI